MKAYSQGLTKCFELDWDKVNSFNDVVLLLKLITGAHNQQVFLYLTDEQAEAHKHLFKDERLVEGNL